jgi:hypothetical protein
MTYQIKEKREDVFHWLMLYRDVKICHRWFCRDCGGKLGRHYPGQENGE